MPEYNHRPKVRGLIREVLKLVPRGRTVTKEFIAREVKLLDPTFDQLAEIVSGMAWLDDEAHIKSIRNADLDQTEWELTALGRQRAN